MKKNGYTLVELIISVILITVLALIIIPNIFKTFKTSRADQLELVREKVIDATTVYLDTSCGNESKKLLADQDYVRVYVNSIIDCGLIDSKVYNYMNDEYFDVDKQYVDIYIDEVGLYDYRLSF